MNLPIKNIFLKNSNSILDKIYDVFESLPVLELCFFAKANSALVIVDMIKGFATEGNLKSDRVRTLTYDISTLSRKCDQLSIPKLILADCHDELSPEFDSYPIHCVKGTSEVATIDEIREIGEYTTIFKNSTNGFLEDSFQCWLKRNPEVTNLIIVGNCTDICIQQFSTTLKAWFNMRNIKSRIIIPLNMVDTFDFELHNGDLMNTIAIYNMMINGIEIVRGVQ